MPARLPPPEPEPIGPWLRAFAALLLLTAIAMMVGASVSIWSRIVHGSEVVDAGRP